MVGCVKNIPNIPKIVRGGMPVFVFGGKMAKFAPQKRTDILEKIKTGARLVGPHYRVTFGLLTILFALWGFANDITNPMVAAFQTVMELSAAKASMVQFAF